MTGRYFILGGLALTAVATTDTAAFAVSASTASGTAHYSIDMQPNALDLIGSGLGADANRSLVANAITVVAANGPFLVPDFESLTVASGSTPTDDTPSPLRIALILLCLSALSFFGIQDRFTGIRR